MNKSFYVVGTESKEKISKWLEGAGFTQVKTPKEAKIVVFHGDVPLDPSTYGMEKVSPFQSSAKMDKRDVEVYSHLSKDQLVIGLSRGAHLACVMKGGKIIQGCDGNFHNANRTHPVRCDNGRVYEMPSKHTQLMYPYNLPSDSYNLLFFSDPRGNYPRSSRLVGTGLNGDEFNGNYEPEIVLFKGTTELPEALAIQGHPEIIPGSPISNAVINLINDLLK